MKKVIIFSLFSFILLILPFNFVFGYCPEGGLVPCGTPGCPCTLCHFFQLLSNIVDFIYYGVAIPLAVLMITIGGFFMAVSYINPDAGGEGLTKARALFKNVAIGLFIVYGSWVILDLFFSIIGFVPPGGGHWWQIDCNVNSVDGSTGL